MRLACMLLAAGEGSRFGGCKQLAVIDGKPLIQRSLETLSGLFTENLYVVVGAYREEIIPVIDELAQPIVHADWAQGIGASIAFGIREIEANGRYEGVLIALADQQLLTKEDFGSLIERFDGDHIVASHYAGALGVPAIFPTASFTDLKSLVGDHGAKSMLQGMQEKIVSVPLPTAAIDVDTPEDIII